MIILGIGSNIGFPLANLRQALTLLRNCPDIQVVEVSSVYISDAELPENAPNTWEKSYLNMAISCRTHLEPEAFHKQIEAIEALMGRQRKAKWEPRIIDIDILAWKDLHHETDKLSIPHKSLLSRPFALLPLLEIAAHWQPPETFCDPQILNEIAWLQAHSPIPFNTRKIKHRLDGPALMGIINLTPDSFSDGGNFNQVIPALHQINSLVLAGAEIIDLGAESTRPGATPISPELEWERLDPILSALSSALSEKAKAKAKLDLDSALFPRISLDSYHFSTIQKALERYPHLIQIINDVSGESCQEIAKFLSQKKYRHVQYISMHNLGLPADPAHTLRAKSDPVKTILNWAKQRIKILENSGLHKDQIIMDIGIGFGLTVSQNWTLLARIKEIKSELEILKISLLIGHSRKSFLKPILNSNSNLNLNSNSDLSPKKISVLNSQNLLERDIATSMISLHLAQQNIDYLRVHHVEMINQAMQIRTLLNF
jgi:2-amino-4-hydroxy-6-hydroxymethyldihydropteridine diphosphokinase/dihydropteroate synthase